MRSKFIEFRRACLFKIYKYLPLLRKKIYLVGLLLIFFGIVLDVLSYFVKLHPVDSSYIFYVFSALATIAALSGTVLTLIISLVKEKYIGFSIKEILHFRINQLKVYHIIPTSLITIVIATGFLTFGFINSVVCILVFIILSTILYSDYVWRMVTKDSFCVEIVKKELERVMNDNVDKEKIDVIEKLFNEYIIYANLRALKESEEILALIKFSIAKIDNENKEFGLIVDKKMEEAFLSTVSSVSVIYAIEKLFSLYNKDDKMLYLFDKRRVMQKQIKKLMFYGDEKLYTNPFINMFDGILDSRNLNKEEKQFVLYQYFNSIFLNQIVSRNYRKELIYRFLKQVTYFYSDKDIEANEVRRKVIVSIVYNHVLINQNDRQREYLFSNLIMELSKFEYIENNQLLETIASIYQVLYSYTFLEKEMITEEHREKLKKLVCLAGDTINNAKSTFIDLVASHGVGLVKTIFYWVGHEDNYKYFTEYFPDNMGVKSAVWDNDSICRFAFATYLLFNNYRFLQPFEVIENWDSIENKTKKRVLKAFINCFDTKSKNLESSFKDELEQISNWLGLDVEYNSVFYGKLFDNLNEELRAINNLMSGEEAEAIMPDIEEINEKLNSRIQNENLYGYDARLPITEEKEILLKPSIMNLEQGKDFLAVSSIVFWKIKHLLNNIVETTLRKIDLSFDKEGVRELLARLREYNIDGRNYKYVDDFGFEEETKELPEFKELKKKIESIEECTTPQYTRRLFFECNKMKFNVKVTNYDLEEINDIEADSFLEKFKVAEGMYKIDDAFYNKSMGIDWIQKEYRRQHISLKIAKTISKNSGFIIDFKY